MTYVLPEDTPRKVSEFSDWSLIHMQASDVPVRISKEEDCLRSNVLGDRPQGIQLSTSSGVISLWWIGPLWVAREQGSTDTAYLEIQAMRGRATAVVAGGVQ